MERTTLLRGLRYWGPVVLWAGVAWMFSTSMFGEDQTSAFFTPLLQSLFPNASPRTIFLMHKAIRKAAHAGEYFLFGLFLYRAIRGERQGWQLNWALTALAIAAAYALIDEGHQIFVRGRGPSLRDAAIDTVGAGMSQIAVWLYLTRRFFSRFRRDS